MKNIHVIPTEKPSTLYKRNDLDTFHLGVFDVCKSDDTIRTNQNIYITKSEDIKEGNWCLDIYGQRWKLQDNKLVAFDSQGIKRFSTDNILGHESKKIILTTDAELDGVQAIDDKFLEWFVNNSTCEYVNTYIVKLCTNCGRQYCDNRDCRGYEDEPEYLISFPENTKKRIVTYCDGYEVNIEEVIKPNY